jgi:hypothetical protein
MSSLPKRKRIGDQHYRLVVMRVTKTFPNGTPRVMERMPDNAVWKVEDGMRFVTGYIQEHNFEEDKERLPGETD